MGGTGTWDTTDTTHWSTVSGGSGGASVPVAGDDVLFDANSFTVSEQVVTFNAPDIGYSIDFTGVTNTPTFVLNSILWIKNKLTFVENMIFTPGTHPIYMSTPTNPENTNYITMAGKACYGFRNYGNLTVSFQDNITVQHALVLAGGIFKLNGHILTAGYMNTQDTCTLDITNSTVILPNMINGIQWPDTTNFTLIATGSTINFTRASSQQLYCGSTAGGPLHFGTVNFNCASGVTVRGSNTFDKLIFNAGKPVNFRAGDTITVGEIEGNGTSANRVPITSSVEDSPFTISKSSGRVSVDYWDIKDCHVTGGASFYAGLNSIDSGGNDGWIWDEPSGIFLTAEQDGPDIVLNWEE